MTPEERIERLERMLLTVIERLEAEHCIRSSAENDADYWKLGKMVERRKRGALDGTKAKEGDEDIEELCQCGMCPRCIALRNKYLADGGDPD